MRSRSLSHIEASPTSPKAIPDRYPWLEGCYSHHHEERVLRDKLQEDELEELTLDHLRKRDDAFSCLMTLDLLQRLVKNKNCRTLDIYLDDIRKVVDDYGGFDPDDGFSDTDLGGSDERISSAEVDVSFDTMLRRNSGLRVLRIWNTSLDRSMIVKSLTFNQALRCLHFNRCVIADGFATALSQALIHHGSIAELHLSDSIITTAGACSLVRVFESNSGIRVLRIERCGIDNAFLAALSSALQRKKNLRLEELYLSGNRFTDTGTAAFIDPVRKSNLSVCELDGPSGTALVHAVQRWFGRRPSVATIGDLKRSLHRLSNANFTKAYKSETPYANLVQFTEGLKRFLTEVAGQNGIPDNQLTYLATRLEDDVRLKAEGRIEFAAAVIWTSDETMSNVPFYRWLQKVLREDLIGPALTEAVRYCRTLNKYVVTQRRFVDVDTQVDSRSGMVWAYVNDAGLLVRFAKADAAMLDEAKRQGLSQFTTRELTWNKDEGTEYTFRFDATPMTQTNNDSGWPRQIRQASPCEIVRLLPPACKTYRTAWLPREHAEWFCTGRQYRYAGYLASSELEAVALRFLVMFPPESPLGMVPVKFVFNFDAARGCQHVNLLEKFSLIPGEREWLFQHYSAFKVLKVGDLTGSYSEQQPIVIQLHVFPDNKGALDSLPIAEWH
eukprot:TRINITY_DN80156_c0_g1_i1.p1 TRINITY_DN80156_c0_g1~~TRINITY_DN80156_c0_g1_i1.p1  ORF type:complete len:668 (+),score=50.92 TRINITY_DN80156_c0_g1_i1:75-2078(+)